MPRLLHFNRWGANKMDRWDYPYFLQFAPSEACNEHCLYCLVHNPLSTFKPNIKGLSLSLIENIMSQTVGWNLGAILPHGWGEPLADPRMPEIFKIIRKYNKAPILMFTNGTICERRHLLMECGEVNITISSATPEMYERIHGVPLYEEAVRTVEWLEAQPNHPRIVLRFVIVKPNMHELEAWRQQWRRFPQVVTVAHVGTYPSDPRASLAAPPEMEAHDIFHANPSRPCTFYGNLHINIDGDVDLCCMSAAAMHHLTFGNVKDTPLLDTWRARCANKMRNLDCERCRYRAHDWKRGLEWTAIERVHRFASKLLRRYAIGRHAIVRYQRLKSLACP
jgi:pyruvate-formate lyase-activating enzyme